MTAVKLASRLETPAQPPAQPRTQRSSLAELAAPGRLVELCGEARTTTAVAILAHAQREGETAAWIQPVRGELYPPDLAAAGVDVEALIVIHVPEAARPPRPLRGVKTRSSPAASGPAGQCRAAELLLRSGGFGLVILDFCRAEPKGSAAWQGRLLGLARQHEARVLILRGVNDDSGASLGPLVGIRVASHVERAPLDDSGFRPRTGRFVIEHEILKNKSGGPLEPAPLRVRGPWGLL